MPDNRLTARSTPTQPATSVHVAGETIGGLAFAVIAGPCSVEGRDMLLSSAASVRASGARFLRGGAEPAECVGRGAWLEGTAAEKPGT